MLGLLFLTAASQWVAEIELCGLLSELPGGDDFVQNTDKFQARQNSTMHLVVLSRRLSTNSIDLNH